MRIIDAAVAALLDDSEKNKVIKRERQVISFAIQTFNQNEYTTGTIIHDGFLVESLDLKDAVLRKAEQAVKLVKGYDIKLEKKSLKDCNEECLWGTTGDDDGEEELQSESDTDIARHFMAFMEEKGHAFTRSENEVFWFNPDETGFILPVSVSFVCT